MKYQELDKLTTEELRPISLQKMKNGCATSTALTAQIILYKRAGENFCRVHSSNFAYDDGSFTFR